MGSFFSKSKINKAKQASEKSNQSELKLLPKSGLKEQKKLQAPREQQPYQRQRMQDAPKPGVLTFKGNYQNSKQLIDRNNPRVKELEGDRWIIDPQIIEHFRIQNIFYMIQESPAQALQLTLVRPATYLIGNAERLKFQRQSQEQQQETQKTPEKEYAIIYADLFSIKFSSLRKIKLKGPDKKSQGAIISLEPIALIQAPLLEQLTANDHPITNVRFLRRCIWPFLSKLSLRNNSIADSYEIASILPTISNVQHIEGIDLPGQLSENWTEIGWICKMGFADAEQEFKRLESSEKYSQRFQNKVLRRIDCQLSKKNFRKSHVQMIRNKFNNPYFDNPISIW